MTNELSRQTLRPAAGGMITVKVADEIARLKGAAEWKSGDRHAISLIKDAALNVLLMVLKRAPTSMSIAQRVQLPSKLSPAQFVSAPARTSA